MNKIFCYILFSFTLICVSCNEWQNYDSRLLHADEIMNEHPDSALSLLKSIDSHEFKSSHNQALYALLLSQALDKNFIDLTNDSLISIAVNHFSNGNNHRYTMLAHYYHARIHYNAGNLPDCVTSCLKAEQSGLNTQEHLYLGLIYRLLLDIFNQSYNFDEELEYAKLSLHHFKKSQSIPHIKFAFRNLACAYNNADSIEQSKTIWKQTISNDRFKTDSTFLSQALSEYAHLLCRCKEYGQAKSILTSLFKKNNTLPAKSYGILAKIYALSNKPDSALFFYNKGIENQKNEIDRITLELSAREIFKSKNNSHEALVKDRDMWKFHSQAMDSIVKQNILIRKHEFIQEQSTKETQKIQKATNWIIFVVTFIVIIAIISIIVFNRKYKKTHKDNLIIPVKNSEIDCPIINTIKNKAKSTSTKVVVTQEEWNTLEQNILAQSPDFKNILINKCKLSDFEFQVCMLVKCNMTPTEIMTLTHKSKSAISSVRNRMYYKIFNKKGSTTDFDNFIRQL